MKTKRFISVLLALCLAAGMAFTAILPASAADSITVCVSFEGYNLGQGFYVEPTKLSLPAGSNVDDATAALFALKSIQARHDAEWGYLTAVKGFDTGVVSIPSYITRQPGFELSSETNDDDWLGEGDYTGQSGWMYTLNHASGNGAAYDFLNDGDVVRWQFSVWGWGNDLGVEDNWGYAEPYYDHADKTELIRLLFIPKAGAAEKRAALDVVIDPLATQAQVAAAALALIDSAKTPLVKWQAKLPDWLSGVAAWPDWAQWIVMVVLFGWIWWLF